MALPVSCFPTGFVPPGQEEEGCPMPESLSGSPANCAVCLTRERTERPRVSAAARALPATTRLAAAWEAAVQSSPAQASALTKADTVLWVNNLISFMRSIHLELI